ncbi:MAG: ribosome recycling factor [Spirochaetaceae bacterium]|nr:ribosome recycling factor [Spirochaetaceae bacterium]
MSDIVENTEERMKKTIAALSEAFAGIRTGRASVTLFEKLKIDMYGAKTPLNQAAAVSAPEARLVVIQPWDKALITEIEKAVRSELSLNPSNDGKVIRIAIPPLTGERRKELEKQARSLAEQSKVALRNIRRDGNEDIKKQLKDDKISKDDTAKTEDNLQKLTNLYTAKIDKLMEIKAKEILEV